MDALAPPPSQPFELLDWLARLVTDGGIPSSSAVIGRDGSVGFVLGGAGAGRSAWWRVRGVEGATVFERQPESPAAKAMKRVFETVRDTMDGDRVVPEPMSDRDLLEYLRQRGAYGKRIVC